MRCDFLGRDGGAEPLDDVAIAVHEELLEVPGDGARVSVAGLFGAEPLIQVARAIAVDFDPAEDREGGVVLRRGELEDLGIGARLLLGELIARERKDAETVGAVLFMKCTQTCVLGRQPSEARNVDDETHRVAVRLEVDVFTGDGLHGEFVHVGHG